jgi:GAF domain-containing protein
VSETDAASTGRAAALAGAKDLATLQGIVTHTARDLVAADGATIVFRDGDYCFYADEDSIAPLWKGQRFPLRECVSGWAMLARRPAVVPDIWRDPRIPADVYRPTFVQSLVMVPIGEGEPVGAIGTYWADRRLDLGNQQVRVLEQLAAEAAHAIAAIGLENAPWAPNFRIDGAWHAGPPAIPAQRRGGTPARAQTRR